MCVREREKIENEREREYTGDGDVITFLCASNLVSERRRGLCEESISTDRERERRGL